MTPKQGFPPEDAVQQAWSEPALEPTDLTLRESMPLILGFLVAAPLIALPGIASVVLRATSGCGSTMSCLTHVHPGLAVLDRLVGSDRLPTALTSTPLLADLLLGLLLLAVVIVLCAAFRVPPFGGAEPLLKVSERVQPRTSKDYDFEVRAVGRPHRIAIHAAGRHTGYPGDALIAIKLALPDLRPLAVERHVRPVAEPSHRNEVTDYVYDPIYYQFIPPYEGLTHLWVGYGAGPECKLKISVTRRD